MFLQSSGLKRIMKKAWERQALVISRNKDDLLIQGIDWVFCSNMDMISNQIKAAVVEFAGKFPDDGDSFRAGKDAALQYAITDTVHWDLINIIKCEDDAYNGVEISKLLVEGNQNVFRYCRLSGKNIYIPQYLPAMITNKELHDEETMPEGAREYRGISGVVWTNYFGTFIQYAITFENEDWKYELLEYPLPIVPECW